MVAGAVRSGGAEHRGVPVQRVMLKPLARQIGQLPLLVCDGIPHDEADEASATRPRLLEEDAAVASVPNEVSTAGRAEGGGGDEEAAIDNGAVREDAEHGGRSVEPAESAAAVGIGDEAVPALADERGAGEARGVVRRQAAEDLFDDVVHVHQRWRRRTRDRATQAKCEIERNWADGPGSISLGL
ncbi:hypothetical protein SETIT_9G193300v2 [Setaria italica]|uniref:Uncharacterized protein n=1 Tax=Setaria italica TaxID=4555 RepID=A0A368SIG8_SETIT|nr:hypothetical protein SETIT_9G193300v2 [Setaria italica]